MSENKETVTKSVIRRKIAQEQDAKELARWIYDNVPEETFRELFRLFYFTAPIITTSGYATESWKETLPDYVQLERLDDKISDDDLKTIETALKENEQ